MRTACTQVREKREKGDIAMAAESFLSSLDEPIKLPRSASFDSTPSEASDLNSSDKTAHSMHA